MKYMMSLQLEILIQCLSTIDNLGQRWGAREEVSGYMMSEWVNGGQDSSIIKGS